MLLSIRMALSSTPGMLTMEIGFKTFKRSCTVYSVTPSILGTTRNVQARNEQYGRSLPLKTNHLLSRLPHLRKAAGALLRGQLCLFRLHPSKLTHPLHRKRQPYLTSRLLQRRRCRQTSGLRDIFLTRVVSTFRIAILLDHPCL